MIITNVGEDYYSFFNKVLKPYNYIKNQDGFNMSSCNIDENNIMFCVRYLAPIQAYFDEPFIPGNYSENKSYCKKQYPNVDYGENFFWNSWLSTLIDNTIFFTGTYKNNKIIINKDIEPLVIKDKRALTKIEFNLKFTDIRLINLNNKVFCHDALISSIFEIKIINNKISAYFSLQEKDYFKYGLEFYNKICNNSIEHSTVNDIAKTPYDKDWSLVDIINNKFFFLNWFEKSYLTCSLVNLNKKECEKINIIKMNNDVIHGLGNDYLPMFSFGSPCLRIVNKKNDKVYIGAGHIKIIFSYNYKNQKILDFIEKVKSIKHVQHVSYIYTMYLFKFSIVDNKFKFEISDSLLLMNNNNLKYKFSINFPMGLFTSNNKINITYGYGDYYNMIASFDIDEYLKLCIHDISTFKYDNFNFLLID